MPSQRLVRILSAYDEPAEVWAASDGSLEAFGQVRVCVAFLREQLAQGPFALDR